MLASAERRRYGRTICRVIVGGFSMASRPEPWRQLVSDQASSWADEIAWAGRNESEKVPSCPRLLVRGDCGHPRKDEQATFVKRRWPHPALHASGGCCGRSMQGPSTQEGEKQMLGQVQRPVPRRRQRSALREHPTNRSWGQPLVHRGVGSWPRAPALDQSAGSKILTQRLAVLGRELSVGE